MNNKKTIFIFFNNFLFWKITISSFDVKKAEILIGFISSLFEILANDTATATTAANNNNIEHADLALQSIELFQSNLKEIVKLKTIEENSNNRSSSGTAPINKNKAAGGSSSNPANNNNNKGKGGGKIRRDPELIALKSAGSECRKGSISAVLNILTVSPKWIQVLDFIFILKNNYNILI